MKKNNQKRTHMKVGDRILINKWLRKVVYLVARVDIPHSSERAFVTRSGGDFTIGLRVWKSDYAWNEKTQMWTLRR
ncbi:MAG: hypothetical protein IH856_08950 [Deltaproteobacteria bacterium]|nr:hypothetical protein [Deltaproteobacteria bacterium]MCZ6452229.1 hypothetical protein [Deltaproteobacteria bacterium]MCZ6564423.1 hypothetical protein [Deltaproteobacteria bacterium]MCZ6621962.1 hypothetical protein [Deltaproteobacteria bacterium]MCZ6906488.1 hypothetical protein [Deltaproteobacteria bacterium]